MKHLLLGLFIVCMVTSAHTKRIDNIITIQVNRSVILIPLEWGRVTLKYPTGLNSQGLFAMQDIIDNIELTHYAKKNGLVLNQAMIPLVTASRTFKQFLLDYRPIAIVRVFQRSKVDSTKTPDLSLHYMICFQDSSITAAMSTLRSMQGVVHVEREQRGTEFSHPAPDADP